MAGTHVDPVLQFVRKLVASQHIRELTDSRLLEEFALRRDQAVFSGRGGRRQANFC
jgi:hypothetical protein